MKVCILTLATLISAATVSAQDRAPKSNLVTAAAAVNAAKANPAPEKPSSIRGLLTVNGAVATIKNSRNSYLASGRSLEEIKALAGKEVLARGFVEQKEGGQKTIQLSSIKAVASQTAATKTSDPKMTEQAPKPLISR